jgi:PAS domain S-box-containing protein
MSKNPFRLGGMRIGARLTACFVAIVLSMMAADVVAVWQFSRTAAPARRLNEADRTSLAVVRVHLDVDTFRDSVAALASTHDIRQFTNEAASLRQKFVEDVAQSQQLLASSRDMGQDPTIRSALQTLRVTLPSQLDTTVELASAGDWPAVSLRVADQVQALIDLSSSLVEKVDREVSQERAEAIESARRARRQLLIVVPVAALLPLLVAVALGWYATRSITEPLFELNAGTRALARGDFHHQVAIQGEDELAHLGQVFNDTAKRLAVLYETLRTNEARFRLAIDTIPGYVWSALPDGSLDFINRRWLEFSGVSLEKGLGWGWQAAVHPDDLPRFMDEWRAAVASGKAVESEARVRRADGQYRWLLIRNVPLHDEGGKIVKWYGTSTDIDDRKRAEETLREQADLLNLTHDAIFVMDMEEVIKYWNRGAEERYGWTAEQAVGRDVHDLLKTFFPTPLEQIKAEVLRTGRWEGELVHTRKDGTQVVVLSRWSLERGEQGAPVAILETNNDITERKRAEEALYRLNRELRAVSSCNQTLLRATDEQSLLEEICRIVCEEAGYRMAWVAYAEHDEAKSVRPAAWTGTEEGYLANLDITWADTERGRGPTGTGIRSGKTCCIEDFATDPRLAPWRESALQRDFRSGIALPLKDEHDNAFGSLTIYSEQPNAFTSEDIRLLEELAADLSFGIVTLRSRAARKRAEEEVALLSFALDKVREAAFLIDDRGHFHYVNEEACRVLGYTRAQLLGMGVADIDPEFPAERWSDHWRELKAQRSLSFESRHRSRDGRTFPVEISANYFEYGGRAYNLALVRDITERKRTEEALRQSEAYLAEAQRLTHTGSWALDVASEKYVYVSEEDFRIWGFDPQEGPPTREAVFRRIHPEDRYRWRRNFENSLREKTDNFDEYRIVLPGGTVKHIHTIRHPVLNDAGDLVKLVGTTIDITERKRAEEALRESEGKYHELVEHANSIILHWQRDGRIIFLNEFGQRFFGYTESEIRGRHVIGTIVPKTESSGRDLQKLMDEICANPSAFEQNVNENIRRNGERVWIAWTNKVQLNSQGEVTEILSIGLDITDRKRAEEALRRSEAYLAEAQRLSQTGSWALDVASWRYVYWSQEMFRIYGFDPQQGLPTREGAFRRLIREDWDRVEASSQRSLREKVDTVDEYRIVLPDGTAKDLRMTRRPVLNDAGDVVQLIGATVDITQRKRAEEALRQSEAYLAEAERLSHTGSWALDVASDKYAYCSEECLRIYGFDPQEGLPTREAVFGRILREDRDRVTRGFEKSLREKVDSSDELRIVLPDGTVKDIYVIRHPVLNDAGDLVKLVGTSIDITERKRAEEALRESETRFRTFVDHAADAFFILDIEQGTIIDVNRQACESLGCTRQELIGATALAFHLDSDQAEMASVAERAAAGETVIDRHWHRRKDGTVFPVEVHTSLVSYGGRRFLLKVARDISDRLRAEEEREKLHQLQADLAHMDRVSMMGELTASLAHELNQPITAVITSAKACLRWLDRDTPEVERARAAALRIENDGTRAAEIISRVRAFYKKGAPIQPELLDVNEVADEMLELLRSEATKFSISMRGDLAAELPRVRADRVQLQQVFMNLMLNGIEAMKETSGELTIKSQLSQDGEVFISVSDTGVGLPAEKAEQVFNAFFTTKEQGIGMGLTISRSIIESHGGRLWASASGGRGATFHFTLPAEREAQA